VRRLLGNFELVFKFAAIASSCRPRRPRAGETVVEDIELPNRGHALTIDSGWREVADTALAFIRRFTAP
jgi:non-heme chloroperoxidase